jgi:hypothetical protein
LEGHLENESGPRGKGTPEGRATPRREGVGQNAAPFADDLQARLAYQTLRAIALDREQQRPTP